MISTNLPIKKLESDDQIAQLARGDIIDADISDLDFKGYLYYIGAEQNPLRLLPSNISSYDVRKASEGKLVQKEPLGHLDLNTFPAPISNAEIYTTAKKTLEAIE